MANPDSIGEAGGMLEATTTEDVVTLDPRYRYAVWHNGSSSSGADDEATIYLSTDDAVVADPTPGTSKLALPAGGSFPLKKGAETLRFATAAGAPVFSIGAVDAIERFA